jgi:hypothetical protein
MEVPGGTMSASWHDECQLAQKELSLEEFVNTNAKVSFRKVHF